MGYFYRCLLTAKFGHIVSFHSLENGNFTVAFS